MMGALRVRVELSFEAAGWPWAGRRYACNSLRTCFGDKECCELPYFILT